MSRLTLIIRTLSGSSIGAVEAHTEITTEEALRTIAGISTIKEEVATNEVATKAAEVEITIIEVVEETHMVVAGTSNVGLPTNVANQVTLIGNLLVVRAISKALGLLLTFQTTRTPFMMNSTKGVQALKTEKETPPLGNRRVPLQRPRLSAKKNRLTSTGGSSHAARISLPRDGRRRRSRIKHEGRSSASAVSPLLCLKVITSSHPLLHRSKQTTI